MGLDIHVRMIIGYKVEYKNIKSKVIRFDEKTGKPYEKTIEEIKCDEENFSTDLEDFTFGNIDDDEEYTCIRGKSLYYSQSNRSINNQIEMFIPVDLRLVNEKLSNMRLNYPNRKIDIYIYPDANW